MQIQRRILFIFIFFTTIHATVYTLVGTDEDFLFPTNWNPLLSGSFTAEDDIILPINFEYKLLFSITVNSITIQQDITLNGMEIHVNSVKSENNAVLTYNGILWFNGENRANIIVSTSEGTVYNYGYLEVSGCSTLEIHNYGTVEVNDKNGEWGLRMLKIVNYGKLNYFSEASLLEPIESYSGEIVLEENIVIGNDMTFINTTIVGDLWILRKAELKNCTIDGIVTVEYMNTKLENCQ